MEQKLPTYFEKYMNEKFTFLGDRFDEKFEDLTSSMGSLKKHVNDEIEIIRKSLTKLETSVTRIYVIIAILFIVLIIGNYTDVDLFDLFIKIFVH